MNSVYGLGDWQFWAYGLWFFVAFFFSCVIPGWILARKAALSLRAQVIATFIIGVGLWGLQGYLFGTLSWRAGTYLYLAIAFILFLHIFFFKKKLIFSFYKSAFLLFQKWWKNRFQFLPKIGWWIVATGSLSQLFAVVGSGLLWPKGVVFYWLNAFDGLFHLTFIESIVKSFPPIQPGAWPLPIANYHYWSDLVMAEFVRVWHIPTSHIYFQYFPVLLAPLMGLAIYLLVKQWTRSSTAGLWALFFHYFAGDMMYAFILFWHHVIGSHTDTIDNGIIQFLNMPQAFAKLLFIGGLLLFDSWQKKRHFITGLMAGILFALSTGFKVYFGLFALLGLGIVTLVRFVKKGWNASKQEWLVLGISAVLAAAVFLPVNQQSGGLFFAPFEWPKLMLNFDKLNWSEWWLRMQVYEAHQNTRAIAFMLLLATAIFYVAVYGTRLIGFLFPRRVGRTIGWHNLLMLYPGAVLFSIVGSNFLQVSGLHNVFNFFVVALSMLSLLSAVVITEIRSFSIFKRNWLWILFTSTIIVFTLPRAAITLWHYFDSTRRSMDAQTVSHSQLEAFQFLADITNASPARPVLLQTHFNNYLDNFSPYAFFFSNQYSYFGGRGILASHNISIEQRRTLVRRLFTTRKTSDVIRMMTDVGITHLVYQKKDFGQSPRLSLSDPAAENLSIVFENEEMLIIELRTEQFKEE